MERQVASKGAEYVHRTGTALQYFLSATQAESSIRRSEMDKLRYDLHWMELMSNKPWK